MRLCFLKLSSIFNLKSNSVIMKRILQFIAVLGISCSALTLSAQRYAEEIFDDSEIIVESDITYATNINFLTSDFAGPNTVFDLAGLSSLVDFGIDIPEEYFDPADETTDIKLQNIKMDVYYPDPEIDDVEERPVIIYLHTGNFLPPPLNGSTTGLKTDSAAIVLCQQWAKRGYVAVSADYRLGWNPLAETIQERRGTLLNAVYRALQDSKMAVRYLREDATEGANQWGIDDSRIVIYGQGSGGYLSQAYATLNNASTELFLEKFLPNPFDPSTSYIDTVSVGNIDGFGFSFSADGTDPDTISVNLYRDNGISDEIHMAINAGGALADESWLEEGDVPMCALNCVRDDFAPFTEGTVVVPTTNEDVVDVHGANFFIQKANDLGNNDVFADIPDGDPFTDRARSLYGTTWETANDGEETVNETPEGLFPVIRDLRPYLTNESGPWDWWDPTSPIATTVIDEELGITAHMASLVSNPDMSPEKGRAYLDTIQGYINPRIMCALDLPGAMCEAITNPPANDMCADAEDINSLFGGDSNVTNMSEPYTNEAATTGDEPDFGWDCYGEPDGTASDPTLESTVWFTMTGDGNEYSVLTSNCDGELTDSYIPDGDTQISVYSGMDCENLVEVDCNEDSEDAPTGDYYAESIFVAEEGVTYFIMIDGFDATDIGGGISEGEFCIEVTNLTVSIEEADRVQINMFPNPTKDLFTIQSDQLIQSIVVTDLLGKQVHNNESVNTDNYIVDLSAFESGIYMVDMIVDGKKYTQKVVKK